jgi:hypothetical protein
MACRATPFVAPEHDPHALLLLTFRATARARSLWAIEAMQVGRNEGVGKSADKEWAAELLDQVLLMQVQGRRPLSRTARASSVVAWT